MKPSTLKDDNKYHCQQCDKKCDAHKVRDAREVIKSEVELYVSLHSSFRGSSFNTFRMC